MSVTLKPVMLDDAPMLFDVVEENREDIERWFVWPKRVHSLKQMDGHLSAYVEGGTSGIKMWWLAFDGPLFVGYVQVRLRGNGDESGIPYWIMPSMRRNRYGTQMVIGALRRIEALGLKMPKIHTDPANTVSRAFAESLGLTVL